MNFPNTWEEYTSQYLEMTRNLIQNNQINKDLIIPTMYIARHYIELRTKMIAKIAKVVNGGNAQKVQGHDLKTLWNESSGLIIQMLSMNVLYESAVQEQLRHIKKFIENRTDWDNNSMALRYPYNLQGIAYNLTDDVESFIVDWKNCMEALEYIYNQIVSDIRNSKIHLDNNQITNLHNNGIII
ncbi:hypothetical protein [Bacillus sp. S10(2024)]|uniref:hypothetical protein n=1 Tax=Bacillus sp. S10(2024) TaxID=3162886 RepID=UPI003D1BD2B2